MPGHCIREPLGLTDKYKTIQRINRNIFSHTLLSLVTTNYLTKKQSIEIEK